MKPLKYFIYFLLLANFSLMGNAQDNTDTISDTLTETVDSALIESIDWIKEKLVTYSPYLESILINGKPDYAKRKVSYYDCNLIVETTAPSGSVTKLVIPLSNLDINNPTFVEKPDSVSNMKLNMELILTAKGGSKVILLEGFHRKDYLSEVSILLHKNCKEENIPEKLKIEFQNVIKLCKNQK